jgi:hypothetical protein
VLELELNVDMDVVGGAEGVGEVLNESRRAGVVLVGGDGAREAAGVAVDTTTSSCSWSWLM